jgi:hypothetical protein
MSFPDFKIPVTQVLKPLQELETFFADYTVPTIDSAHTTVPTITSADIGGSMQNTNVTANNFAVQAFKNAGGDQVYIGAQFIGSGATAGGHFIIATNPVGGSAPIEALRVLSDQTVRVGAAGNPASTGDSGAPSRTFLTVNSNSVALPDTFNVASEILTVHVGLPDNSPGGVLIDTFGSFGVRDFRAALGTASSRSALTAGTLIGVIGWLGATGASTYSAGAAQIRGYANENFTPTANGSHIRVLLCPDGAAAAGGTREVARFPSAGGIHLGTPTTMEDSIFSDRIHARGTDGKVTTAALDSYGAFFPLLVGRNAGGTFASPTATAIDKNLLVLSGQSYETTTPGFSANIAAISMRAAEAQTLTAKGTYIILQTTPIGSTTLTEAVRIGPAQNLGVGTGATISARIHSLATTEQLRLGYDASNYVPFTVSSGGNLTIAPTGGAVTITGNQVVSGTLAAGFLAASGLTNGRVPIVGSAGVLGDDADLTFSVDTLTSTKLVGSTHISTPLLTAAASLQVAPTGNVGFWTSTFGTAASNVVAIANGLVPTSAYATGVVRLTVEDVVTNLGGTQPNGVAFGEALGVYTPDLGSQLVLEAKGFQVRSHMSVGLLARVSPITGGASSAVVLSVRETFTGDMSATGTDPAMGATVGKRAGILTYVTVNADSGKGLKVTDEIYGNRSLLSDLTPTGTTHLGKIYGATGEIAHSGAVQMNIARGLYGVYSSESGAGPADDVAGVVGLINVHASSSAAINFATAMSAGGEIKGNSHLTNLRGFKSSLDITATGAVIDFHRHFRAETPTVTAGSLIDDLIGFDCLDQSGITGVKRADNIRSRGVNSQNIFEGAVVLGGRPLEADTLPQFGLIQGQSAYGLASTNVTGGDLLLTGGFGRRLFTVIDIASGTVTLTVTVNGTAVTFLSGTDFNYGATTTTAATNLAAAINANSTLNVKVRAVSSGANVILYRRGSLYLLSIATNNAARTSVTQGDNGKLNVYSQLLTIGDLTTATANKGIIEVTNTITNNASGQSAFRARNTFNGSGSNPNGADIVPTFAPSASIALARGVTFGAFFSPPTGVTITDVYAGNTVNVYGGAGNITAAASFLVDSPINTGGNNPTTQYGLRVKDQGLSGMTTAYGLYVEAQADATNNFTAYLNGEMTLAEMSVTPPNPTSGTEARLYMKGDKLIFQFNDGGTVRYKYLDLTGTGVTWVHTTSAP